MKCNEFETRALAYMDGTLPRAESDAVERHLASCASCAERTRGFVEVSKLLDGWEPIQPSASFNARLQQRILEQPARGWWERLTMQVGLLPVWRPAAASAMLAMALFAVIVVRYLPTAPDAISQNPGRTLAVITVADSSDELALYQDLAVLENWDLLSNFEVLQELETTAR